MAFLSKAPSLSPTSEEAFRAESGLVGEQRMRAVMRVPGILTPIRTFAFPVLPQCVQDAAVAVEVPLSP